MYRRGRRGIGEGEGERGEREEGGNGERGEEGEGGNKLGREGGRERKRDYDLAECSPCSCFGVCLVQCFFFPLINLFFSR